MNTSKVCRTINTAKTSLLVNKTSYQTIRHLHKFIAGVLVVGMIGFSPMLHATNTSSDGNKLAHDARKQIGVTVSYDPAYRSLAFPRGDVDQSTGVCTDVVIRAYRLQNIDLQQLVNHDMKQNWSAYPKLWGLKSTDKNIDHRRVPNLETFFERHGQSLSTSDKSSFMPGDIVSWRLPGNNLPHIGIVSDKTTSDGTPLIIHNIGQGTKEEAGLFRFPIKGHFRY